MTRSDLAALPVTEFAFPGPVRDKLVEAILAGEKTATTGLVAEFEREGEALPTVGGRALVVDSEGKPVAVIATRIIPRRRRRPAARARRGRGDSSRSRTGAVGTTVSGRATRCEPSWAIGTSPSPTRRRSSPSAFVSSSGCKRAVA